MNTVTEMDPQSLLGAQWPKWTLVCDLFRCFMCVHIGAIYFAVNFDRSLKIITSAIIPSSAFVHFVTTKYLSASLVPAYLQSEKVYISLH